jgi:hypothetical protein
MLYLPSMREQGNAKGVFPGGSFFFISVVVSGRSGWHWKSAFASTESRSSEGVHRRAGVISGSASRRRSYATILGSRWTSARFCQCSLVKFPGHQVQYQPNPISTASAAISTRGVRQRDQEHGLRLCLLRTRYLFLRLLRVPI